MEEVNMRFRRDEAPEFDGQEVFAVDTQTGEVKKVIDHLGRELLDSTPMAPPLGYKKQPSMVDMLRDMVRSERLRQEALASGHESFEDADNFEIADDEGEMPTSPHENEFDPPVKELLQAGNEVVIEKAKKKVAKPTTPAKVIKPDQPADGDSDGDGESRSD